MAACNFCIQLLQTDTQLRYGYAVRPTKRIDAMMYRSLVLTDTYYLFSYETAGIKIVGKTVILGIKLK